MWVWFHCIPQTFWGQHRFSAFWLRSKCSICSYQLNIWYGGHVPPSILNWFLQGDEVQELAPASSRVGLVLQYRQDRPTSPLTPEDPPHHQPQHQPIIVLMVSIGFETKVAHFTPTTSQKRYWPKLNCKESPQTDINCCSLSDHPPKLKSWQKIRELPRGTFDVSKKLLNHKIWDEFEKYRWSCLYGEEMTNFHFVFFHNVKTTFAAHRAEESRVTVHW